jgi:hypothetical protein
MLTKVLTILAIIFIGGSIMAKVPPQKEGESKNEHGSVAPPKKSPEQPFYCHLKDGKWDGKFRDKSGNVVEQNRAR